MSELYTAEGTDLPEPQPAPEATELSGGDDFGEPKEPESVEDDTELPDDEAESEEPEEPEELTEGTAELLHEDDDVGQPEPPEESDPREPAAELAPAEAAADEPEETQEPEEPEKSEEPDAPQAPDDPQELEAPEQSEEPDGATDESFEEPPDEASDEVRLAQAEAEGQEIGDAHGVQVDYTTNPLSPDSANDVNQAMEKLSDEYPGVFQGMEVVRSEAAAADSTLAYAVLEPGGPDAVGIYLDSGDFGDYEALSEQGKLEEESNWTVPGGGSVEGIFHHEFGHHLAQQIFDSPEANQELETVVSDAIGRPYDTSVEPHDDETAAAIEPLVSEYGATDPHEMVAECFTEYKLADNPRPFAMEVGQIIDKYLKDTKE